MARVKRFDEMNENFFYFNDYVDLNLLQDVIDGMKPTKDSDKDEFKKSLIKFNSNYNVRETKRLPATMGKQVAWWVDLFLVQDCIDRMNPSNCTNSEQYKKDLKEFLS